jgi:CRP-like cAMP-binding protein
LPYLYVDLRDRALLHQHEAAWFHGWALASVVSTAGAGILAAEWLGWTGGFFLAVGAGLVALAMVCPFVSSDLAMILEGVTGVPGLARRTRSFLMNRVLRSLFATQRPEKAEAVILVTSALSFVYLFGAGLVLFRLALHMVDLGIWAVTGGQASWWESVLASLVVLGVWGGFLGVLMALLVTTLRTLFQASRPVEKAALPRRSTPEQGISLDGLAQELAVLPPFNALPPELVVNTVSSARMEHYRAGDWILRQGDAGSTCYVLRKGHCRAFVRDGAGEDVPVGDLGPGSLFGEVALLDSRPRTASVRATEDTEVMVIDGPRFIALVEEGHLDAEDVKTRIRFHGQLKSHAVFQWMAASSLAMLLQAAVIRRMSDGTVVLSEGEQGDTLYLIHSGDCRVSGSSLKTPVVLTAGDLFGEMVVFRHAMARTATVTSQGDSVLVEIPGEVARKSFAREFSAGVLLDRTMQQRMEGNAPPEAGRVTP